MEHVIALSPDLFLILGIAKLLGGAFREPPTAGCGGRGSGRSPPRAIALGIVPSPRIYDGIPGIGVILLLWTVGLETKPSDILTVGGIASRFGLLGIILPFVLRFA